MLTDEDVVSYMYNYKGSILALSYDLLGVNILRSDLYVSKDDVLGTVSTDVNNLIRLGFLTQVSENKDEVISVVTVKYRLSKRAVAMLDTVSKYKILRLQNIDNLNFLDLAKTAVLLSHSAKGMVDFEFEGIKYTVRLKTDYRFFEEQYKLKNDLRK